MPPVRILDNMRLPTQGYAIRIKEMEAGAGEVRLGQLMAMDPRGGQVELPGEHVREPAFGLPATWIDESLREEATFRGYTIVDPATVLTTHLTEILKENMPDLLSYAEVQKLLKDLPAEQKKLVEDLIPVGGHRHHRPARAAGAAARAGLDPRPAGASWKASARPRRTPPRSPTWSSRCAPGWPASSAAPTAATTAPCRSSPCRRSGRHAFAEALIGQGEDKQLALAPSRLQDFIRGVRETFERAALAGDSAGAADQPADPPLRPLDHRALPRPDRGDEPERNPPQGAAEDRGHDLGRDVGSPLQEACDAASERSSGRVRRR